MTKFSTKGEVYGLSVENILKKTTEAEIYRHYIGDYQVGQIMSAPYRKDRNPSFSLYYNRYGQLRWKDFSKGYNGGIFDLLVLITGRPFNEVLLDVDRSMNLGLYHHTTDSQIEYQLYKNYESCLKSHCYLQRIIQPFTIYDKDYWKSGNISKKTLEYFEIYSTKKLFYNHKLAWIYKPENPIYSWEVNSKLKAYRPNEVNPKNKWMTNFSLEIQGYNKLPEKGDILCITKSMKDITVYHEIGIPAIAPQSEHILFSEKVMSDLDNRFNYIFTNFDNDKTGKALAEKYEEEYGLHSVFLDEFKDPFEYSQNKGLKKFENEIKNKTI